MILSLECTNPIQMNRVHQPMGWKFNGKLLVSDIYYYIIKLSAEKAPVSGSVTWLK